MNLLVIDHRQEGRGANLRALIERLGHKCRHVKFVWGDTNDSQLRVDVEKKMLLIWDDRAKTTCSEILAGQDIVLLHKDNSRAVDFARDLCMNKYVIFYSGGGLRSFHPPYITKPPQREYEKHCVFAEMVPMDAEATWDLKGCLDAISQGDSDFCERLHAFDPLLEAKLDLLYELLGENAQINPAGDTWRVIQQKLPAERMELLNSLATRFNQANAEERSQHLRELRDTLLEE